MPARPELVVGLAAGQPRSDDGYVRSGPRIRRSAFPEPRSRVRSKPATAIAVIKDLVAANSPKSVKASRPHSRSNNMTPHSHDELSIAIDRSPFAIAANPWPP